MKKVLCPVEGKNGKTFWLKMGRAFDNKDGSMNVFLDAYPANGKLQVREMDERDFAPRDEAGSERRSGADLPF